MIAWITGASGFVGRYLIEELLNSNHYKLIIALDLSFSADFPINNDRLIRQKFDITIPDSLKVLSTKYPPNSVFHLAALSNPQISRDSAYDYYKVNVLGTVNLLESARRYFPYSKILLITSSEVYGKVSTENVPITEETPLRPQSPYGVTKASNDLMGFQYAENYGLNILRLRSFNHSGPRQLNSYVLPSFASEIVELEKTNKTSIKVGNLTVIRDFMDVRDTVSIYNKLSTLETPKGIAINICSGKGSKISDILNIMIRNSKSDISVIIDKEKFRESENPIFFGDNTLLKSLTNYKFKYTIKDTAISILNFLRSK